MATKNGIHYLDPRLLGQKVRVVVIGTGGTGSHVAANLAVLHQSMLDLGHPEGLECTLIDDDTVTSANTGRARFFQADIGQSKAYVLANRINACHGQAFRAIRGRVDGKSGETRVISEADIVIGCVDTRSSRRAIHEALHTRRFGAACYWIDLGNSSQDGQVILGEVGEHADRLPCITELFREMLDAKLDPTDDGPSCSRAEALAKQSAFVNASAALHAVSMLSVLFSTGQLDHCGIFFNLQSGRVSAMPCDPQAWARLMDPEPGQVVKLKSPRKARA